MESTFRFTVSIMTPVDLNAISLSSVSWSCGRANGASCCFCLPSRCILAGNIATHQYRDLERFELERISLSLATTGVFGNPYAVPTGPSAHVSPGYALILAGIFRLLEPAFRRKS